MEQEVKTENEQKKEYLRSYKDHVRRVNRISEEIKELREMMMSTKAINYDGMPHGSGGQGDLSGEVARIQGLIDELKRERGLRIMTYQDIARRIKKLRSRNEDDVLFYRYIKGMEWYEIAETMSYSERQIHRIHGKALAHLELPEKDVSSTCGIMISSKDERKDDFQFFNFLKKYIQNLEGTAWQQAVLLLHNVVF